MVRKQQHTPDLACTPYPHAAEALFRALFKRAPPQQYLELRPLPTECLHRTLRFLRLRQFQRGGFDQAVPELLVGKADVSFGVLHRSRKGGTAADVEWASCSDAYISRQAEGGWALTLVQVLESSDPRTLLHGQS